MCIRRRTADVSSFAESKPRHAAAQAPKLQLHERCRQSWAALSNGNLGSELRETGRTRIAHRSASAFAARLQPDQHAAPAPAWALRTSRLLSLFCERGRVLAQGDLALAKQ